ncbi:MAG: phosphoribosylamine--glycine ligase [Thermoplasmatales archaeon]|nr:phosphoribosylamine--glycine ligase [Thermoplasmatales archaeon]MCW6171234.1 phosphoribosylamine--glycine ligase [Thermoplasmatales archaeon]
MERIMLIGGGGREDAIARKIVEAGSTLISVMKHKNPSIHRLSSETHVMDELDYLSIVDLAKRSNIDLVFVGPDPVLETPLVDTLESKGIKVASPSQSAARLETSKFFMRELLKENNISGNVNYKLIGSDEELLKFFEDNDGEFAVKPLGLTGGKGVKVMGEHLPGKEEAIGYAREILKRESSVLLEEKLYGEEFSLQAFTDGKYVLPMPLAQDYKRAFEGDTGPNTGGMGSISDANHLLPFISGSSRDKALEILKGVVSAMRKANNTFKGVIYGQFMETSQGPKVVEINARFADPESMNVLTIFDGNFTDVLFSIADGTLGNRAKFLKKSTVVKYIVPRGYGTSPQPGNLEIDWKTDLKNPLLYYSSVSGTMDKVEMTSSRALALAAIGDSIPDASDIVEKNLHRIRGEYYVRHDIGTEDLIQRKIENIRKLSSAHRS